MATSGKKRKITNAIEIRDALVEDIFRYEELAEMEANEILSNVSGGAPLEEIPENAGENLIFQDFEDEGQTADGHGSVENANNPRFVNVTDEDTDSFIQENRNRNTGIKTKSDLKIIHDYFVSVQEFRDSSEIPISELDSLLARFYLGARKRDGTEYEPGTLISISNSLDRYLRDKKLNFSIKKDAQFAHSRRVLEAKTKSLKSMGKGNKPNAAEPLTSEELKILREKGIIGTHNPSALLNLVWLNNSMFFGLRGRQDHVNMHWGDILLKKTSDGKEYLQFNERSTKTRSGVKVGDIRAVPPRAFAVEDDPYCPVNVYKEFRRHRPSDMCEHESRFYLRALVDPKTDVWYSRQTIGKDKLGQFMKNMAEEGKLEGRKVNHSGRKTFATSLLQSGKAVTEVAQLGGWKNIQSVTHYAVPSIQQQEDNSNIISNILRPNKSYASTCDNTNAEGTKSNPVSLTDTNNNATVIDLVPANNNATVIDLVPTFHTDNSADSVVEMSTSCAQMQSHTSEKKDNPMNLFQNAVISGGTININIIAGNSKKKNSSGHYLSSQTNEIVSSQE